MPASTFDEVPDGREPAPSRAVAVPLDHGRLPSRRALRDLFFRSNVLGIPLASFSVDPQVTGCGLERFAEIDIPGCIAANRRIISQLLLDKHSTIGNYFEMAISPTDLAGRVDTDLTFSGRCG
ncbi:hypothetical protein [Streptomyces sp. NPDC001980]|uniref:hypothetical protein n=1 Tax=Streptomyces sp. NPDC001980 TaxID=3157126 RepID=UPI00333028FC